MSTPILYIVINYLTFGNLINTIIANFIGAILMFKIDEFIFNKKEVSNEK